MPTVREAIFARLQRLQDKKARLVAEAQSIQSEIDALKAERDTLTQAEEDRFIRLQALAVIAAKD